MKDPRRHLPPLFQKNEVLFGHDATPGLIACEIDGADKVKIFRRDGDATVVETAPFQPLMLLAGDDGLKGWQGETQIEPLAGSGAFNRLALFPNLKQLDDAKAYLQKNTGKTRSAGDAPYWYFSDPLRQFLLLSGKTHFLGMTFRDLKRLQLDIEAYCQAEFFFPNAFSYKMKNYALLDEEGRLRIKGSGLRSGGLELFQREWLEEMLLSLLKGEKEKIPELYRGYLDDIENHHGDISWLMKTETLQDSLDNYQAKVKAKKRNAAAPYELALKVDRPYQPGDQISYYVTGTKTKVKVSENCKLASEWNPKLPDENVEHYKAKLKELYEKFRPFVEGDRQRDGELALGTED
jgi:hypothetical protein